MDITHPKKMDRDGNVVAEEIDFKGLNYTALIPFLIQGIKDQQSTIEELQNLVASLMLHDHENSTIRNEHPNKLELNNLQLSNNGSVLYQNEPNPFHS